MSTFLSHWRNTVLCKCYSVAQSGLTAPGFAAVDWEKHGKYAVWWEHLHIPATGLVRTAVLVLPYHTQQTPDAVSSDS